VCCVCGTCERCTSRYERTLLTVLHCVLQRVLQNVMQCALHTAPNCKTDHTSYCNTLQHTATHCNTLQHTATHCNTHDSTHCNTLCHTLQHTGNLPCNTHSYLLLYLPYMPNTQYHTLQHTLENILQHTLQHAFIPASVSSTHAVSPVAPVVWMSHVTCVTYHIHPTRNSTHPPPCTIAHARLITNNPTQTDLSPRHATPI